MRLARRTFLRLLATLAAVGILRPVRAHAGESAYGVHRATSNTLLGAIGEGIRRVRAPLALGVRQAVEQARE
jgi:hypothetical protein